MKINRNNKFIAAGIAAIAVAGLTIGTSGCFDNSGNEATEVLTKIADSTSDSSDTTDSSADADLVTNIGATSIGPVGDANPASGDVSGAVSESAHSDATSADDSSTVIDTPATDETSGDAPTGDAPMGDAPMTDGTSSDVAASEPEVAEEAPATEAPGSDTPAVEIPSDHTAPGIGSGEITAPTLEIELNPGATVEGSIFFGADGDADASLFLKESGFGGNDIVSVKLVYYVGETKTTTGATLSRTASTIRSIWRAENMQVSNGTMVSIRVTNSKGVTTYTDVVVEIAAPM